MTVQQENIQPSEPVITTEQLLSIYKHAFAKLQKENHSLRATIAQQETLIETQHATIELIAGENDMMLSEIHRNNEKVQQMIKKDEMKTALIKQLMQNK
jgi:hypothetical protein